MAVCRVCSTELPPEARFCPACGTPVEGPPSEGFERKVVTVLFVDLAGSTSFTEQRDPEDVQAVIQPYFARVRGELERFGGTFEKFIGDAVMALFGAPVAHEDDPERAVRAALAIRDAIVESGALDPELDLHVRIAVNTGEAVIALGARLGEGEGMAAGDVVHTAFRMQEAAPPNGVVVGEQTFRATRNAIEYGDDQLIAAKGKAAPIRIWEAVRALAPLRPAYIGPGLAPFVGRRDELSLLVDTLARVRRESSVQLLTLTGVPGIGKSRLVWELMTALEREPAVVAWRRGRCLPYGDGVSFWALGEMVKAEAGIVETDEAEDAAAKLSRSLQALLPRSEATWVEGHLRPLTGVGIDSAPQVESQDESFAAWRRFLEALAERGLLVLLFEDLHWADDGLLDFVNYLADWAQGVPLLIVGTARPELLERRPEWGGGKRNAATIALSPLSGEETGRLVAFLLRRARLPEKIHEALLERSEGNPLYAEEYARMLGDRGLLDGAEVDARDLPLPESVQAIIASRLDTLPPDQKNLLHDAAVVGRGFWVGALSGMAEEPSETIEERLHALELKDFVRRQRDSAVAGERQYAFLHALVREVSYAQIPRAQRAQKHCLAAEWLDSLARPEDFAEMVAHHYLSALEFARAAGQDTSEFADRARVALGDAGDRAFGLNAFANAARFYKGALDLTADGDRDRPMLLFRLGRARFQATAEGADELAAARDPLLAQGDAETAAKAEVMLYSLATSRGEQDEADEHIRRAATLIADAPPSDAKAYVLQTLASRHLQAGDHESAVQVAQDAIEIAKSLGLEDIHAGALATAGGARAAAGDPDGIADLERSVEIADRLGSPASVLSYMRLAGRAEDSGDLRRRAELHARARVLAERFGIRRYLRWLEGELVGALYWAGRWGEALEAADAFVAASSEGAPHYLESFCRVMRGRIHLARGNTSQAQEDAARALERAHAAPDPQLLHPALAFSGRVAAETGDTEQAGVALEELMTEAEDSGNISALAVSDAAVLAAALGRPDIVAGEGRRTRWLEAGSALASGDPGRAASLFAEIGSLPDEAYARLLAAERAAADGRRSETEGERRAALSFFRSVEASAYARRAEALLAPSA